MGLAAKRILGDPVRQRQENRPPIPVDPATLAVKKQKQDGPRSNINNTITFTNSSGDVYATIEPNANGRNSCNDRDERGVLATAKANGNDNDNDNDNDNPPPPIHKDLPPKSLQGHCSDPLGGYWAIDLSDRKRKRARSRRITTTFRKATTG